MPRRNRRYRYRYSGTAALPEDDPPLTYEQMARELVNAGLRSPLILEHPQRLTERTEP